MRTLLLWDIDSTLLNTGPAGKRALLEGLRAMSGLEVASLEGIPVSGRTDPLIIGDFSALYGLELTPERAEHFYKVYLEALKRELHRSPSQLNPGIQELIDHVDLHPDIAQGVLTGNCAEGARIKLSQPHINLWVRLPFGAFGDDGATRNDLGPHALTRATAHHGVEFDPERVFVIGDTTHDVECGKAVGAKTVAVLTGKYTREQLEAAEPDFLFNNLTDLDRFLEAIDHA